MLNTFCQRNYLRGKLLSVLLVKVHKEREKKERRHSEMKISSAYMFDANVMLDHETHLDTDSEPVESSVGIQIQILIDRYQPSWQQHLDTEQKEFCDP